MRRAGERVTREGASICRVKRGRRGTHLTAVFPALFFLSLGRSLQGFLVSFSNSATTYYGDTFIEKSAYCTKISFYLKNWFSFGVNDIFFTDR